MKKESTHNRRRNTRQRQIILEELSKVKSHPKADTLFQTVRKRMPAISMGTVYRNLNLLKEEGKVLELACGRYSSHYDADTRNHYHFFCVECESIFDLDAPILQDLDITISRSSGMRVAYHRIHFYGYCRNCKDDRIKSQRA